ncbi:hypothetical protein Leryth_026237 [Lithospermum erythrorhizon]|nr:hypothetical protein Leryth_026237 [Lithospermum erythrorhizon]
MENPLITYYYFPSITILAIVSCLFISHEFPISEATRNKDDSFSIDLFHRDSPKSPLYDHTLSYSRRLINCLMRSFQNNLSYSSALIPDHGEYLLRILLGTPPIETWAIADTGSDLIWTQCKPCIKCFKQKYQLFNPIKSSTFKKISCNNGTCDTLERSSCDPSTKRCSYSVSYGDGSYSNGEIARETVRLSPKVAFQNITIGCAHQTRGTFGSSSSGVIGLGGGKSSLISQMGSRIRGKFSYCLVDFSKNLTSRMNFGMSAIMVHGKDVVTTPIATIQPSTFFFLTLEGISVGKKRLDLLSNQELKNSVQEGNTIIDSGTTLTLLPKELYYNVKSEIQRNIKKSTISDPEGVLDLCYPSLSEDKIPIITMHFKGADVELNNANTFVKIDENVTCLAFASSDSISIYGNIAQINFLVGYDLEKKTVSFKHTHCGA